MKVTIIGAGIGGLTAALALSRRGVDVKLFERAEEILPLGAGLSLWGNAVACLSELGLKEALFGLGRQIDTIEIRTKTGDVLVRVPMQRVTRSIRHASVCIERAALQQMLVAALPLGVLHLGCELISFKQNHAGSSAQFANGRVEQSDWLIGADGLHSTIRAHLVQDGPPQYAGYGGWLGIARFEDETLPVGHAIETWGRGERFGMLYCGEGLTYWFCPTNRREPLGAVKRGKKSDLLDVVHDWHAPIPAVIAATDEQRIVELSFFDREPLRKWTHGRISLLGDAAHPMTPNMGQGACQAIEDAVTLSECLCSNADSPSGLQAYEKQRIKRTTKFVRKSRLLGRFLQNENALLCWARNSLAKLTPADVHVGQMIDQFKRST